MMKHLPNKEQFKDRATIQCKGERRREADRRREESCGFACISTVGWICRRERTRRKDDPRP
jgi:hypothetical protein